MNNFVKKVQHFLVSEDGPTAVEYAIMVALIGVVVMTGAGILGTQINTTFTNLGTTVSGISTSS